MIKIEANNEAAIIEILPLRNLFITFSFISLTLSFLVIGITFLNGIIQSQRFILIFFLFIPCFVIVFSIWVINWNHTRKITMKINPQLFVVTKEIFLRKSEKNIEVKKIKGFVAELHPGLFVQNNDIVWMGLGRWQIKVKGDGISFDIARRLSKTDSERILSELNHFIGNLHDIK